MDENYISPEETEAEKIRLIGLFTKELKIHGLLDLTGFIDENTIIHKNHTHTGFVRSTAYKIEQMELGEVIPIEDWKRFLVKSLNWQKRHPYWYAIRINILNSIFTIAVGLFLGLLLSRPKETKLVIDYKELPKSTDSRDSVAILQREINSILDSAKTK